MDELESLFADMAGQGQVEQPQAQETTQTQATEPQAPLDSTSQGQETSQTQTTEATAQEDGGAKSEEVSNDDFEDWDSESTAQAPKATEDKDEYWKELSKELNLPFEGKTHVVEEFKRMSSERETMKKELEVLKSQDPYASDDFKKANEIAKLGGDWREYLEISSVNYDDYDDQTLIAADISRHFPDNEQGREEMNNYLMNMSDYDKRIQASRIRESLKMNQSQMKMQKEREAIEKKRIADETLRATLDKTEQIAGLKIKPNHRKEIYEDISSGNLVNQLFYDGKGNLDFKKMIENAFVLKNIHKIVNYYQSKSKNEGKKEIINSINNLDVNTTSRIPSPTAQSKSALDSWMDNLSQMR